MSVENRIARWRWWRGLGERYNKKKRRKKIFPVANALSLMKIQEVNYAKPRVKGGSITATSSLSQKDLSRGSSQPLP